MKKKMKVVTKLIITFIIMDLLIIFNLYLGYSSAQRILVAGNPEKYLQSYRLFTGIMMIVALALTSWISISIINTIRRSIAQLTDVAKQISMGKVDVDLVQRSNDEFGILIGDYQRVVDNIRYQANIAEQVAEGNMTIDVIPRSEEDLLGTSLKKLVKRNRHALSGISDAAYQVTTSSSEVASASEALAQGSTEQASAIEEITASISDIAEKTKQNAKEANSAAELVDLAIEDVKKGNDQMQDMMVAMKEINASSESISKIIKVIDDIAFQTNILALNAAVEAARAGEAGKGFAVVAEEVRNLAAKSASAASETAELIEDSIRKVESGSKIADETAKALEEITDAVQKSETIISGIAEASNYQATAITQINQAIGQVSQVVQNNSATSEQCAAASIELSNQATRMRELLSVYRLGSYVPELTANSDASGADRDGGGTDANEPIISLGGGFGKY